jgi:hypothetical protein
MKRLTCLLLVLALAIGCENGGATRTLGISATGVIYGQVYFDANASRVLDAEDAFFTGARIRVTSPGGSDTLFRATTSADGRFRIANVPVGTYAILIDSSTGGDSAIVVSPAPQVVTLLPGDSAEYLGSLSFPIRSVAEAKMLAPGVQIFVQAVALHSRETFSDTVLHVVDATGAIRATRVQPTTVPVEAGDSVVLRARVGQRLGQRVLDGVAVFRVSPTFIPPAPSITTAQAATGGTAGSLDASLVRLLNAQVIDTSTVAGNFQMTMNDGSGPVTLILDRSADLGFRAPLPPGLYVPTNRFDVTGVLVPTGTGTWRVKPRSALDMIDR